jgi:dipeptidase
MTRPAQIEIAMMIDADHDANPNDYLFQDQNYQQEDQRRLEAWRNGDWHFIGIRAKAQIKIPYGTNPDCWIISKLLSPGLWGVESDSGEAYVQQVYQDERDILLDMLTSLKTYEIRENGSAP